MNVSDTLSLCPTQISMLAINEKPLHAYQGQKDYDRSQIN